MAQPEEKQYGIEDHLEVFLDQKVSSQAKGGEDFQEEDAHIGKTKIELQDYTKIQKKMNKYSKPQTDIKNSGWDEAKIEGDENFQQQQEQQQEKESSEWNVIGPKSKKQEKKVTKFSERLREKNVQKKNEEKLEKNEENFPTLGAEPTKKEKKEKKKEKEPEQQQQQEKKRFQVVNRKLDSKPCKLMEKEQPNEEQKEKEEQKEEQKAVKVGWKDAKQMKEMKEGKEGKDIKEVKDVKEDVKEDQQQQGSAEKRTFCFVNKKKQATGLTTNAQGQTLEEIERQRNEELEQIRMQKEKIKQEREEYFKQKEIEKESKIAAGKKPVNFTRDAKEEIKEDKDSGFHQVMDKQTKQLLHQQQHKKKYPHENKGEDNEEKKGKKNIERQQVKEQGGEEQTNEEPNEEPREQKKEEKKQYKKERKEPKVIEKKKESPVIVEQAKLQKPELGWEEKKTVVKARACMSSWD